MFFQVAKTPPWKKSLLFSRGQKPLRGKNQCLFRVVKTPPWKKQCIFEMQKNTPWKNSMLFSGGSKNPYLEKSTGKFKKKWQTWKKHKNCIKIVYLCHTEYP